MNMQMLKDEWVSSAEYQTESGENRVLNYFLKHFCGEGGETLYGLKIDKSTPEGVLCESEETFALTECRDDALIMAKAFAKGSVPPVTLLEMADEWQSESEIKIFSVSC